MENNKQITPVAWLVKHLSEKGYIQAPSFGHSIIDKAIEQAKAMHKEETCQFVSDYLDDGQDMTAEEYYEEIYGGE